MAGLYYTYQFGSAKNLTVAGGTLLAISNLGSADGTMVAPSLRLANMATGAATITVRLVLKTSGGVKIGEKTYTQAKAVSGDTRMIFDQHAETFLIREEASEKLDIYINSSNAGDTAVTGEFYLVSPNKSDAMTLAGSPIYMRYDAVSGLTLPQVLASQRSPYVFALAVNEYYTPEEVPGEGPVYIGGSTDAYTYFSMQAPAFEDGLYPDELEKEFRRLRVLYPIVINGETAYLTRGISTVERMSLAENPTIKVTWDEPWPVAGSPSLFEVIEFYPAGAVLHRIVHGLDAKVGLVDELGAAINSRLAASSYTAPPTAVQNRQEMDNSSSRLASIDSKTTNLPSDPADQSLIIAATDTIMARLGAPDGTSVSADISAVITNLAAVKMDTVSLLTNLAALAGKFVGITLVAAWARLLGRSDAADATAKTEFNAGGGTYNEATDSLQALRDNQTTAAAIADAVLDEAIADHQVAGSLGKAIGEASEGSGGAVVIGPVAATVRDVAIASSTGGVVHPLRVFEETKGRFVFQVIDGNGDPLDMTGNSFRFTIHDSDGVVLEEFTGPGAQVELSAGDPATPLIKDVVTVTTLAANNDHVGVQEYKLRNTSLDVVIATGQYRILPAPTA